MDLALHGQKPTKQFVLDRWFQKLPNALVATSLNHFHVGTKEDVQLQPQHSDPHQTLEEQRLTAPSLQEHKGCTLPRDEGQKKLPRKALRMLSNAFAKVTIDELQISDSNAKTYKKPKKTKKRSATEQLTSESTRGRASTGVEDSGGRHVHKRRRLRGTKKSRREAAAKWREHFAQQRRREKEIFAALPPPIPGRYSLRSQALLRKCESDERLLQGLRAHPQVLAMRQRAPQERNGSSKRDSDAEMMEGVVFEEC